MTTKTVRLPDLIIAGAQKSGTTTLHMSLRSHDSIFFPDRPQELHFFDVEENYAKGTSWYRNHFRGAADHHRVVAQTSPLYLYEPNTAERIAGLLPDAKLVFVLRNPVSRAYSHYWHAVKKGYETLDFEEALEREDERIGRGFLERRRYSYVDRGRYASQLARFRKHFSPDQILVLLTEEMSCDLATAIDRCCDFLEIDRQGQRIVADMPKRRWNASRYPRWRSLHRMLAPLRFRSRLSGRLVRSIDRMNLRSGPYPTMEERTRVRLAEVFADEVDRLSSEFGVDVSPWAAGTER